jgi:hypothetical protein
MQKAFLVSIFAIIAPLAAMAQNAATFHVFPQIADGRFPDGSFYQTIGFATNINSQSTTCSWRLVGVPVSRLLNGTTTGVLPALGSVGLQPTSGNVSPLATGYATLTCDHPVTAYMAYVYATASGVVSAQATVFSSPPTMRAQVVVIQTGGNRTAFAIANDTDNAGLYHLSLIDDDANNTIATTTITVPARSNLPRFVDEILTVPPNFTGSVVITSTSSPFSAVGLIYNGSVFASEPVTIY